jgi:hypothetical protein
MGLNAEYKKMILKANPPGKGAVSFFLKHAGWGYDPKKETKAQGRRRGAKLLAEAEAFAEAHRWKVEWKEDPEEYQMGDAETEHPKEVLVAVLKDRNGRVLGSLGGIGDPTKNYGRVIEAELALEAMDDYLKSRGKFSGL